MCLIQRFVQHTEGIKKSMQPVWTKRRKEFGGDKKVRAR